MDDKDLKSLRTFGDLDSQIYNSYLLWKIIIIIIRRHCYDFDIKPHLRFQAILVSWSTYSQAYYILHTRYNLFKIEFIVGNIDKSFILIREKYTNLPWSIYKNYTDLPFTLKTYTLFQSNIFCY